MTALVPSCLQQARIPGFPFIPQSKAEELHVGKVLNMPNLLPPCLRAASIFQLCRLSCPRLASVPGFPIHDTAKVRKG